MGTFLELQRDPAHCSVSAVIASLTASSKLKDIDQGRVVHAKIFEEGLERDFTITNTLVNMYSKSGSLADAQRVFDKMPFHGLISWNALIGGYAEHGSDASLHRCLERMRLDAVSPNPITYLCILKSCDVSGIPEKGLELHAEIMKKGYDSELNVGNYLVHTYINLGFVAEAWKVLSHLPARDVVSWTAYIAGCVEYGNVEDDPNCLELMKSEGVPPNEATYICILRACGSMAEGLLRGRELHAEITKVGLERSAVVGNILVDVYGKCNSIVDAQAVFDKLPTQDVVSWTALLNGYAEHGLCRDVLKFLQRMQAEGITPNAATFICSLKACQRIGDLDHGLKVHGEVVKEELEGDLFLGNMLIDLYGGCGLLVEAEEVLQQLPAQNVVSWTALISAFAEQNDMETTERLLKKMQSAGIPLNSATLICSLKACAGSSGLKFGQQIHITGMKMGFEGDIFFLNSLVDMYAKCDILTEAQAVFHRIPHRNLVSWNSLMAAYEDSGLGLEAFHCLENMHKEGVLPDTFTFACALKACTSLGSLDEGHGIHAKVVKEGLETNLFIANNLIDMYATHGLLAEAQDVFDGQESQAVVAWTVLIGGYTEHGYGEKALNNFEQMQSRCVGPDATLYVCTLKACGDIGALEKGQEIFSTLTKVGIAESMFSKEVTTRKSSCSCTNMAHSHHNVLMLHNILIDMYCKCGVLADAQKVFNMMPIKNLVTWNALISGHALSGEPEASLFLFTRMKLQGMQPDATTFATVLTACNHVGLVDKGYTYIGEIREVYSLQPTCQHYNCMVDMLARAGRMAEAAGMAEKMPFQADLVTWMSVLSSSRKCGNVEVARRAFDCAVKGAKTHLACCVVMSNLYVDAQMWEEAREIDEMRAFIG